MSRIDEMIAELCPGGVEYRKIKEIVTVDRGVRVVRKDLSDTGDFPVYQNSLTPLGFYSESNVAPATVFIIGAGAAGDIGFSLGPFWAADDCYPLVCSNAIDSKYLFHCLLNQQHGIKQKVRKASIPRLSRSVIESLLIPVPPMEIQKEVVRILDSFAELEARKAQYAFYRDELLNFKRESSLADSRGM